MGSKKGTDSRRLCNSGAVQLAEYEHKVQAQTTCIAQFKERHAQVKQQAVVVEQRAVAAETAYNEVGESCMGSLHLHGVVCQPCVAVYQRDQSVGSQVPMIRVLSNFVLPLLVPTECVPAGPGEGGEG